MSTTGAPLIASSTPGTVTPSVTGVMVPMPLIAGCPNYMQSGTTRVMSYVTISGQVTTVGCSLASVILCVSIVLVLVQQAVLPALTMLCSTRP